MRVLHFSDLHLGVETYGNLDPATGLSSRTLDVLKALDQVVNYALEAGVDLVLFCGDAYKSRDPSQTQQREFAKRIRLLSASGIPIFLLVGNHDLPYAVGKATTVEIFDTLEISNVHVGNRADIYRIPTKAGWVQVVALPWPKRSAFLSREETKNLNIHQINDKLQAIMTERLLVNIHNLEPDLPSILAAHISVSTAKSGSERSMMVGQEPVLLVSNVAHHVFDYVALGHIHQRQELKNSPPVIYSGSLERLDFTDEGEDKGFYLIDIKPRERASQRQVDFVFQKIDARQFLSLKISIAPDDPDPTASVLKAIAQRDRELREAIVKVEISLPAHLEASLQDAEIRKVLKEVHSFTIAKDIRRPTRFRLGTQLVEEITPLQALKLYLESKKVSSTRQKILLEYGERLISSELTEP